MWIKVNMFCENQNQSSKFDPRYLLPRKALNGNFVTARQGVLAPAKIPKMGDLAPSPNFFRIFSEFWCYDLARFVTGKTLICARNLPLLIKSWRSALLPSIPITQSVAYQTKDIWCQMQQQKTFKNRCDLRQFLSLSANISGTDEAIDIV